MSKLLESLATGAEDCTFPPQLRTLEIYEMETAGGELPARFFEQCSVFIVSVCIVRVTISI